MNQTDTNPTPSTSRKSRSIDLAVPPGPPIPAADDPLKELLTRRQPFGPIATPKAVDEDLFCAIFDKSNHIYQAMKARPTLICGRRGAGKTAFLSAHNFGDRYSFSITLDPDEEFPRMMRRIEQRLPGVIPEEVSLLWTSLLWGTVFNELVQRYERKFPSPCLVLSKYLDAAGIRKGMSLYAVMKALLNAMLKLNSKLRIIADAVDELAVEGVNFGLARKTAVDLMKTQSLRAVILIDSLEQFPLHEDRMRNAMAGLLKAVGSFNQPGLPCEVRCCLPSELYPRLLTLSSNVQKDFQSNIVLQWTTRELLRLAGLRYRRFIRLYGDDRRAREIESLDLNSDLGLRSLWRRLAPEKVTNRLGQEEYTIPYIMRHTQLLPRQLLLYLNEIGSHCFDKDAGEFTFQSDGIVKGIRTVEHMVCEGIFNGYLQVFPQAPRLCEVLLPNLGVVFTIGEFQKQFRRLQGRLPDFHGYDEVLKILIQIGVVGVATDETASYINGTFEYALPSRLNYSTGDRFCIHPVFLEEYRIAQNVDPKTFKPVYPRGSQMENVFG
jgi:hypothetical protein